jgi:hypothetical protein
MNRNVKIINSMPDKIEIRMNKPNRRKTSKYAKKFKIKLLIFNRGTLK